MQTSASALAALATGGATAEQAAQRMPARLDGWTRYRHQRALWHGQLLGLNWIWKSVLAAGFAGLIALLAQVSIPLPWTPVPFSLQVLGVLVTGAVLGRSWGFLSVVLYLVAGAIGLEVFADQSSSGVDVLSGYTAGYLFAFPLAAWLVGFYMERRRRLLAGPAAYAVTAGLAVIVIFALISTLWIATAPDATFESSWSATQSLLWLFVGMTGLAAVAAVVLLARSKGQGWEKLNLFLVMMTAIALVHLPGVVVLKVLWPFEPAVSWNEAIALGSTVFLPFDLAKAGLATAASILFLPSRDEPDNQPGAQ